MATAQLQDVRIGIYVEKIREGCQANAAVVLAASFAQLPESPLEAEFAIVKALTAVNLQLAAVTSVIVRLNAPRAKVFLAHTLRCTLWANRFLARLIVAFLDALCTELLGLARLTANHGILSELAEALKTHLNLPL